MNNIFHRLLCLNFGSEFLLRQLDMHIAQCLLCAPQTSPVFTVLLLEPFLEQQMYMNWNSVFLIFLDISIFNRYEQHQQHFWVYFDDFCQRYTIHPIGKDRQRKGPHLRKRSNIFTLINVIVRRNLPGYFLDSLRRRHCFYLCLVLSCTKQITRAQYCSNIT